LENIAEELRTAPFRHGAIEQAGCAACHTPHGSLQPSLLQDRYPAGNYAEYRREDFGMCWQCHSPALVEAANDPTATAFRDGDLNLHWKHISALKKGRSCHLCHAAHVSDGPHLIRPTIRFQQWVAPLRWVALAEGGRCASPCHQEKEYHRTAEPSPPPLFPSSTDPDAAAPSAPGL
jgi:predicted CXXCH cytochrome family protein